MVNVYLKGLRKRWLTGIAPPLAVAIFIPMIASIWPDMKAQAALWSDFLENPIYQAMLGNIVWLLLYVHLCLVRLDYYIHYDFYSSSHYQSGSQ